MDATWGNEMACIDAGNMTDDALAGYDKMMV
jgi:hypothetical protein